MQITGIYLDNGQPTSFELEEGFLMKLNRELEISEIELDGFNLNVLAHYGYQDVENFYKAYQNGELEHDDLCVYMAVLNHGLATNVADAIEYVSNHFIQSDSWDNFDFQKDFAYDQAQELISTWTDDAKIREQIASRFDYDGYERDIFIDCYTYVKYLDQQYIFSM
ncbi:antirestriction protein ArdA (plasmid) [Acinetobacter indicus]|uniref:antirestriction protein ArdA n=1 Tax=Acinetobacter indicus TaxID=756892 RepID=UPI001FA7F201|nr:antirestriction protein ArdA [Acinetobacter indicus]UNW11140.1 antirestriction protein ArdA [Acinetobacter indicus]